MTTETTTRITENLVSTDNEIPAEKEDTKWLIVGRRKVKRKTVT